MPAYRKKPIPVEAIQWFEPGDERAIGAPVLSTPSTSGHPYIPTLEGPMQVTPGDWIIRGVLGEFYPCKPDVFALTYEPA